jgi:ATP-dependent Clp protease ATP-binding subunit ClpC
MFERYTEAARRVIFFARFEASEFGAPEIDTEHLLLGVLRQDKPLLDRLVGAPVDVEAIRREIADRTGIRATIPTSVDMPLSMASTRVLMSTAQEAQRLNHERIGTQHLVLGLLLEEESFAAEMLRGLGLSVDSVRADMLKRANEG